MIDLVAQFSTLLRARFGLSFTTRRQRELEAKLARAVQRSGLGPDALLLELSRLPVAEGLVQDLLSDLTIGETYFFRDRRQLEILERLIFPEIRALVPRGTLRTWSAGCASGEEVWTLAILFEQASLGSRSAIVGTDITQSRLERARDAVYGSRSLLRTDPKIQSQFFCEQGGGHFQLRRARLAASVRFLHHNLLRDPPPTPCRDLALIVCRNVLIYYEDLVDQRVILEQFCSRLLPGGFLVLGHSERIPRGGPRLEPVYRDGVLVYRRPLPGATSLAQPRSRPAAPPDSSPAPPPEREQEDPAPDPAVETLDHDELLDEAHALADAGDPVSASVPARKALEIQPSSAPARMLLASLAESSGEATRALEWIAAGLYLAPDSLALHCFAASLHERLGLPVQAQEHRRVAKRLGAAIERRTP